MAEATSKKKVNVRSKKRADTITKQSGSDAYLKCHRLYKSSDKGYLEP